MGGLGGLGEVDSSEANTLSLLQAMQSVQEGGMRRTASPIGSIAQALIPIFAAPIQARRMEQESQLKSLLLRAQIVKALSGEKGRDPAQIDLDKAQAESARATAKKTLAEVDSPFGGKSPTEAQLAQGKMSGDPRLGPLYDFMQAADTAKRAQERELVNQGQINLLDARENAAELKRRAKALPSNTSHLDPTTGRRLNIRTVGELEDLPFQAKALPTRQGSKISDIKTAFRELQALRGAGKKVLYDIPPGEGSLLGDFFGVTGKRLKSGAKSKAGDVDVKGFEAYQQSFPLALSKALQETSRQPPVAEFGAVKNISSTDSVQSMDSKLDKAEEWLVGVLHDYGFEDPYSVLQEGPSPKKTLDILGLQASPASQATPVALDFDSTSMRSAFENIKSKYPKMTPTEMADFYSNHGDPGR